MWKRIHETDYFLLNNNYSEVFVTNYITIWFLRFPGEAFLACLKNSNDGLVLPEKEMMNKGKNLLSNPTDLTTVKETKDGNTLILSLIKSFGYPFKLKLRLTEGSKELFFQKITLPLLRTLEDLKGSEAELKRLLVKKDQEIEEYKCEGGEIALRHLKTVPFNEEAHILKHTVFHEHFGADQIPEYLLKKTVDVPEYSVKLEPNHPNELNGTTDIKQEPKSEIKEENGTPSISFESVKIEPSSQPIQTSLKEETLSQSSIASGSRPNKRQRRMLNL